MGIVTKIKNILNPRAWDLSTVEGRESLLNDKFEEAKTFRMPQTRKMIELDEYYHNRHYTKEQINRLIAENGWDFVPPILPDPFIQVESQINPNRPDFTFRGRDDDQDSTRAKERQEVVEYILYNTKLDDLIPNNDRVMNKIGDCFYKVAFDGTVQGPGYVGEITIGDPDPANIFPYPQSAYTEDDCEIFYYPYRIHHRAAYRKWKSLAQRKILDTIKTSGSHGDTEIYNVNRLQPTIDDDTFQVIEAWYKDDEGDIACSIQIERKEIQFIKKYWENTRLSGNKMLPFVKLCKIPVNKSFWSKGEIESIIELCDAGDREFLMAHMNDMFNADDMIVCEDEALKAGTTIEKKPGGIIWTKPNKGGAVRRLGGRESNVNALNMVNFIHEKIQETNGNFNINMGKEPQRNVKTLGALVLLNEKGDKRTNIKETPRNNGFRRLYELIDWTVLEFINVDRAMLIRGKKPEETKMITFNSDNHRKFDQKLYLNKIEAAQQKNIEVTPQMDNQFAEESFYYPRLDTEIMVSNPIQQSKGTMIQATENIASQMDKLTPAKAVLLKSEIDIMGLPNAQDIKDAIDQQIQTMQQQPPQGQPLMGQPTVQPNGQQTQQQLPPQGQQQPQQINPAQLEQFIKSLPEEVLKVMDGMPEQQRLQMIQEMMKLNPQQLQQFVGELMGGGQ